MPMPQDITNLAIHRLYSIFVPEQSYDRSWGSCAVGSYTQVLKPYGTVLTLTISEQVCLSDHRVLAGWW